MNNYQLTQLRIKTFNEINKLSISIIKEKAKELNMKIIYYGDIDTIGLGHHGYFSRLRKENKTITLEVSFYYQNMIDGNIKWNSNEPIIKLK